MPYGYDQYGNYVPTQNVNMGGDIGSGALSGAALGTSIVPGWGTLIGGVVGAGVGLFTGLHQKAQAKKLLGQNPYPTEQPPAAIQQNAQTANRLAQSGLPSAQYEQAMKNIQRQQQNSVLAAQDRRAGMESIGQTNQATNDAYQNLSAADAEARRQNILTAMGANQTLGQYQQNAFDWNAKSRYLQNYSYAMGLLGSGNQNMIRGIDTGLAGLARVSDKQWSSIFGGGGGGTQSQFGMNALPSFQVGNGADLSTGGVNSLPIFQSGNGPNLGGAVGLPPITPLS